MKTKLKSAALALCLASLIGHPPAALAQGTAFTYQGRLNNNGSAASGSYDLAFVLYATITGGTAIAGPVTNSAVAVTNGLFTTLMDFGNAFTGGSNWLELAVSTNAANAFSTLAPRQQLTPVPYAIMAGDLSGTLSAAGLAGEYSNSITLNNPANEFSGTFSGDGTSISNVNASALGGWTAANFWQTMGNLGTSPALGNFLGTLDNQPLEFWVNDARGFRIESTGGGIVPNVIAKGVKPAFGPIGIGGGHGTSNIIGGASANYVASGQSGSTIAGGGGGFVPNFINSSFSVIGGGEENSIGFGADTVTIGGGYNNSVHSGTNGFIGGGSGNVIDDGASGGGIVGGQGNKIQLNSAYSIITGGSSNRV